MSALTRLNDLGLKASLTTNGNLRLQGLASLEADARESIITFCQKNKPTIIKALKQTGKPGECEACPAAGYWDYSNYAGAGLLCFYKAYFLGKSGKPKPCSEIRAECPLNIGGFE